MATKTYRKSRAEDLATRKMIAQKGWSTINRQPVKEIRTVQGRNIPILTEKDIDQAKIMQNYKPEMFMLENLIEIGADKDMKQQLQMVSELQKLDWVEEGASRELDRIGAEEWAEKYLKKNKENENKENENKENKEEQ